MVTDNRTTLLENYRKMSLQADNLASSGKILEALALLREYRDKAERAGDEDYRLFFESELLEYTNPDYPAQLNLLNQSLSWGHSNKMQPDYFILKSIGICLSKMDNGKESIDYYKKALHIKPDDDHTIRCWAVTAYNNGEPDVAYDKIREAAKHNPKRYEDDFRSLMRITGKDPDIEWQDLFPDSEEVVSEQGDRLRDIRDFVGAIRANLGEKGQEFLRQKAAAENNVQMFLKPESLLVPERSFFLVLRKWNSFTPAIPSDTEERSRGGGYFIYHNSRGTVIDPGYNFIENFHNAGCRIHDIDNIVITHAHNDHTIDFESICTLLYCFASAGSGLSGRLS